MIIELSDTRIRELAKKIAGELFSNGQGQKAERLVLEQEHPDHARRQDLGGWSQRAVEDIIQRQLCNLR